MRGMAIFFVLTFFPLVALTNTTTTIGQGQMAESPFGNTLDGEPVSIAEHKNKVIVAMYYTSWCGYCRKAMPHFKHFQQVAANSGLQVVFINHKEDRKLFREHVRWAKDTTLVMAHDKNGQFGDVYSVESYPHIIVTDHTGEVVVVNKGWGDNSSEYYAKLLAKLLEAKKVAEHPVAEQVIDPPVSNRPKVPGVEINRDVELAKPDWSEIAIPKPVK